MGNQGGGRDEQLLYKKNERVLDFVVPFSPMGPFFFYKKN
jgi:hypothetical protein